MSRIYINGFDHENLEYLVNSSYGASIVTGIHDKCISLNTSATSYFGYTFPAAYSELNFGFNFDPRGSNFNFEIHTTSNPSINNGYVLITGNTASIDVSLINSTGPSVVSEERYYTATPGIMQNVQIEFVKSSSEISISVKINNSSVITVSEISCTNSSLMDSFSIRNKTGISNPDLLIDDVIIDDTDWVGMSQVQTISPNAEGDTMLFSANVGNTYDCVKDPYSEASYIYGNAFDDLCLFELENLIGSPTSIKSLSLLLANQQAEGTYPVMYFQDALKSGSSVQNGSSVLVAGSVALGFQPFLKIWETSPFTSSAWTESEINGLQAGIQLKSS